MKGEAVTAHIILLISKEKIYGFPKTMEKILFEFSFDKIKKLEVENLNPKSVYIELSNYKIQEMSIPSIVIYIENREHFQKLLKCYYRTYFSEKFGVDKQIKIKTVDQFNFFNKKNVYKKISFISHELPEDYFLFDYNQYK